MATPRRCLRRATLVLTAATLAGCNTSLPYYASSDSSGRTSNLSARPQQTSRGFTIATTSTEGPVEGVPVVGDPMLVPHTRTLIVPFVVQSDKGIFDDDDPYTRRGGTSTDGTYQWIDPRDRPEGPRLRTLRQNVRWHNALFRDLDTGSTWTLLDQRGVVSMVQSVPDLPETDADESLIAFVATIDDTNSDGRLNNADARVLIVTNGDGTDPRVISPRDGQLLSFTHDAHANALWLDVIRDSDADGRFGPGDERQPYLWMPGQNQAGPVISQATIDQANALLRGSE